MILTDDEIRKAAEFAAEQMWPESGYVGWTEDDAVFHRKFVDALLAKLRGGVEVPEPHEYVWNPDGTFNIGQERALSTKAGPCHGWEIYPIFTDDQLLVYGAAQRLAGRNVMPLVDKREGLGMQLLPMTNQCHKCKEWFHTVHVCADSVKVRQCCDHCDDGDGHSVFPYYGVAPHTHADGPMVGSTRLLPRKQWGDNFREDPDALGAGTYLRCPQCKRGEPEAA